MKFIPSRQTKTMIVAAVATAYIPALAVIPMADVTHKPAAVVSPFTTFF